MGVGWGSVLCSPPPSGMFGSPAALDSVRSLSSTLDISREGPTSLEVAVGGGFREDSVI